MAFPIHLPTARVMPELGGGASPKNGGSPVRESKGGTNPHRHLRLVKMGAKILNPLPGGEGSGLEEAL